MVFPARQNEEEPSPSDLLGIINELRDHVLGAHSWCQQNLPDLVTPTLGVVAVLATHTLEVSNELGEAGFECDNDKKVIKFNGDVLLGVWLAARKIAVARISEATPEQIAEIQRDSLRLYLLHETVHIVQNFSRYELADRLKGAFGPDELSKFDLVADVAAVTCATLTKLSDLKVESLDSNEYLRVFATNLLLAYELLRVGFKTASLDHKKKRALGLLTSLALVRIALATNDPERRIRLQRLATTPAFTSIQLETGTIVAITCCAELGGWKHLFSASASPEVVAYLWTDPGDASPERAIGYLLAAYRDAEFKDDGR